MFDVKCLSTAVIGEQGLDDLSGAFGGWIGRVFVGLLCVAGVLATQATEVNAQSATTADTPNEVATLDVQEAEKGTYLRLKSSQTPSFSVFKLRDPLRLVVDVSNSVLKSSETSRQVNNGVVSRVALLESIEDGRSRVRLIVGFETAAHYDVRTEGDEVVIFVEGEPAPAGKDRVATQQTDKDEDQKLQQARQKLKAKNEELARLESKLKNRSGDVESLRASVNEVKSERDAAQKRLSSLKQKLEDQRVRNRRQASQLEELKSQKQQLDAKLESSQRRVTEANERLQASQSKLDRLKGELASLRKKRNRAEGREREKLQQQLDQKVSKLDALESELKKRRRRVETLKDERDQAQQRLTEMRRALDRQKAAAEKASNKLAELQKKRASLKDRLERQREELAATRKEAERAKETLETMRQKVSSKDERIAKLRTQLENVRDSESSDQSKVAEYEQRIERLESELEQSRSKVAKLEERRKKRRNEVDRLKSQRRESEQALSRLRERLNGDDEESGRPGRAVPVGQKGGDQAPNTIRDIRLEHADGESRIVVKLERPGQYRRMPWKDSRAVMLLNNVELPEDMQRTIAADGSSGAVRFVSSFTEENGQVRMEAELKGEAKERIRQRGNKLVWEFAKEATAGSNPGPSPRQSGQPQPPKQGQSVTSAPPSAPQTVVDPSKVEHVPGMSRTRLTIDLRDADIQNVLRLFAKEGGVNIIAGSEVSGNVTLRLNDVPLDQAFLIILQSLGLGFEVRGNVIRVAPQKTLMEERKARQEAAQRAQKLRPLEVYLMPINYASASDIVEQVERLQSPRGSVSVDERTNTLIIKDLPENIESIRQLVKALDTQVPQVLIEARIVETNDTFSQEFGIQWGGDFTMSQGNGNPTGLVFPNVVGLAGGATDGQTPLAGTAQNPNFAVNLPAAAGTGSGGAIGLTLGSVNGAVNLNLRLSAAEESGRAKIISAPKILTLDNREATISQGTSIPISVVSAAGVQTVFVDATLELTVKPHVTPDGNVQLEIEATKNEPDFQNTGARGDPTIIRKQAETELLIEDGETTVIGGIYTRNSGQSVTGVPFLHRIPILGLLFKKHQRSERRSELMIFITPRIVNRGEALGGLDAGDVQTPAQNGTSGASTQGTNQ
jgi:type IV pilus assembly protein PilQ